jgi:FMN phosphatase YigB (HAD superfamily)
MEWTPDVDDTLLDYAQQHAPWRFAKVEGQAQAWTQVAASRCERPNLQKFQSSSNEISRRV